MKFFVNNSFDSNGIFYWIDIDNNIDQTDIDIANLIGISFDQYQKELLSFNNRVDYINWDIIFYNKEDVERALEYMINKYGVLLALIGENNE